MFKKWIFVNLTQATFNIAMHSSAKKYTNKICRDNVSYIHYIHPCIPMLAFLVYIS